MNKSVLMKSNSRLWQPATGATLMAALSLYCRPATAAITVFSAADNNGVGTLRSAVTAVNMGADNTIDFAATMASQTITLTLGELQLKKNVTITGLGPTNLSIVDANGRVFHVMSAITASISGFQLNGQLTGTNGSDGTFAAPNGVAGESVNGGCILNDPQCVLTVSNCFFPSCQAVGGNGGNGYSNANYGFLSNGGNGGAVCGGAICNDAGDLYLYCCTLSSNSASAGRGGNGFFSGTGGAGGPAQGGAVCDTYGLSDIRLVNCTCFANSAIAGYGGDAGDAWTYHLGAANGGTGGAGGDADGGAIFFTSGCPDDSCLGMVHNTLDQNSILPGKGQPGGAGINGGIQGAPGANGAANGGGLVAAQHLPFHNNIVAGDFANFRFTTGSFNYNGPDVFGPVDSFRYNLIGVVDGSSMGWVAGFDFTGSTTAPIDPVLGPLQNNGGETLTQAPLACSPAIDRGTNGGFTYDQILRPRPVGITSPPYFGDGSDIGAFELQSYPTNAVVPLTIARSGNGVVISWPASSCFVLQQTSDLNLPNWVYTPNPFIVVGDQKEVAIAPALGNLFFRLFHP